MARAWVDAPLAASRAALTRAGPSPSSLRATGQTRGFIQRLWKRDAAATRVKLDEKLYDKQHVHYTGTLFGVPVESIMYYMKLNGTILAICGFLYIFFKGSVYMTQFSLATVGKMGFFGGFATAVLLGSLAMNVKRKYHIPPNAVYNQAIAMCMRDQKVAGFLGQYPKTGNFRAYCASGGFKLPLMRRLRSGQYELADLLGTKPRKLQMMFVLKSADGKEGLVSCEVRKAEGTFLGSSYYFHSLAVHLSDPQTKKKEAVVLVGSDSDIVYNGIMNL